MGSLFHYSFCTPSLSPSFFQAVRLRNFPVLHGMAAAGKVARRPFGVEMDIDGSTWPLGSDFGKMMKGRLGWKYFEYTGVNPKIVVFPPKSSHFKRVFHYKPSILGYPYFWKHPHLFHTFIDSHCIFFRCLWILGSWRSKLAHKIARIYWIHLVNGTEWVSNCA